MTKSRAQTDWDRPYMARVSGWFLASSKAESGAKGSKDTQANMDGGIDLSRALIDKKFVFSVRRINIDNLEILPIRRLAGGIFNAVRVRGVADVTGSAIPFFVREADVPVLEKLIRARCRYLCFSA